MTEGHIMPFRKGAFVHSILNRNMPVSSHRGRWISNCYAQITLSERGPLF